MAKFKALKIGDTVRVVSLADTEKRCCLDHSMEATVGGEFSVTQLFRRVSTGLGQVKLSNGWWYSPKGLEVVEAVTTDEPTGDDKGEFVTPETPEGTRVVYVGDAGEDRDFEVGTVFKLRRHDGDKYPRVDYEDKEDYEYIHYDELRVHTAEGVVEVTEKPTPEPVEHTEKDFKYTRVRVKETGAKGVVVGRSTSGQIAVLHDDASGYHSGTSFAVDFVGVPNRIYYYRESLIEIIGGVQ